MAQTGDGSGETYVLYRAGPDRFLSHNGGARFDLAGARRFGSAAEAADYRDRFGGAHRDAWQVCRLAPGGRLVPVP
jgi:hypothetical protein